MNNKYIVIYTKEDLHEYDIVPNPQIKVVGGIFENHCDAKKYAENNFFRQLETDNSFWCIEDFPCLLDNNKYKLFKNNKISHILFDGPRKMVFSGDEMEDWDNLSDFYLYGRDDEHIFQRTVNLYRGDGWFRFVSYEKGYRYSDFSWTVHQAN